MLENGKVLQQRYRIERQIGQGGMGAVYLATDSRFNSTVAIKETLIADENFKKALGREARLLNSLKHVALPKVSDHFIEDKGQYIVMEYITGEDLYELMERSGSAFPIEDIHVWAEQLLDALEYLHNQENPIIHRDIKPQNLKLTPQGQIILLDFGLAKGNPTDANHKTAANSIFGYSRHYASLEQIQGTGTDPRSDLYSLAATLYHLATGKPPADALTRVMNVMNEEPDPLQPANFVHEQVDEQFAAALEKCMSLNANLRPQSVAEMYELLFSEQKTVVTQKTKATESLSQVSVFSTQNTKILPSDRDSGGTKPSDVRTEVMNPRHSDSDSVATRMTAAPQTGAGSGVITNAFGGRKRLYAAVAALGLLISGSVIAMVYFADIATPGNIPEVKSPISNQSNKIRNPDDSPAGTETADTIMDSSSADDTAIAESEGKASDAKTAAARDKPGTAVDTRANKGVAVPSEFDLRELKRLEKELGKDFQFKMKDGKIVTDSVIVDNDGVLLKPMKPGEPGVRIPISREEFDLLTPEQRKKLRIALEMRRNAEERAKRIESARPVPPVPEAPPPDQ